ncbi:hypothetical protein BH20ACT9_BH20ACT9_22100 [soil metagenome]
MLALLVVEHATGSRVLGALAFTVGFVALSLGRSELFTENFLVPVAAVVARRSRLREVVRLWAGTLASNLVGGWVVTGLVVAAKPSLAETAIQSAGFHVRLGIGWQSMALALVGGAVITVMTWMERGSETEFGKVAAAVAIGFILPAATLTT